MPEDVRRCAVQVNASLNALHHAPVNRKCDRCFPTQDKTTHSERLQIRQQCRVNWDIARTALRLWCAELWAIYATRECKSTTLNYYFDDAGLLRGIQYWFGYYPKVEGKEHYDEIYGLMCEKYGTPAHDNDGEIFYVITPAFDDYLSRIGHSSTTPLVSYAEWIVEFNDTWVEIDVVLNDVSNGKAEFSVGYRSISKEEMTELIANKAAEAAEEAAQKEKEQNSDI